MKSLYIVYITNCFLWIKSDNKAYLISSYDNHILVSFLLVGVYSLISDLLVIISVIPTDDVTKAISNYI